MKKVCLRQPLAKITVTWELKSTKAARKFAIGEDKAKQEEGKQGTIRLGLAL